MSSYTGHAPYGDEPNERVDNSEHVQSGAFGAKKVVLYDSSGNEVVSSTTLPSNLVSGRKTVAASGTAEALVASSTPCKYVLVSALLGNTNPVTVGDSGVKAATGSTQEGVILIPGNPPERFDITDIANLFVDSQTNGEGVAFAYFT